MPSVPWYTKYQMLQAPPIARSEEAEERLLELSVLAENQPSHTESYWPQVGALSKTDALRLSLKFKVGDQYKLLKEVGAGSYGEVAMAVHIPTGKHVAIKRINYLFEDETDCKR